MAAFVWPGYPTLVVQSRTSSSTAYLFGGLAFASLAISFLSSGTVPGKLGKL